MFVLHCTKTAKDRLKVETTKDHRATTTLLGNWYCNECTIDRRKYLLFLNEQTLLPVIIPTKGVRTTSSVLDRFKQRLIKIFMFMDLSETNFMPELMEMEEVGFAKTANRSIIGSMIELIAIAKFMPSYHGIEPDGPELFDFLSQVPMKAIDHKHSVDLVAELLGDRKEPPFQLRIAR